MSLRFEVHRRLRGDGSLDAVTVGAYEGDAVLGDVSAYREREQWRVLNLDVAPDARRHGIGTGLLEQLLDATAEAEGMRGYIVDVAAGNEEAIRLYERVGFRRIRTDRAAGAGSVVMWQDAERAGQG